MVLSVGAPMVLEDALAAVCSRTEVVCARALINVYTYVMLARGHVCALPTGMHSVLHRRKVVVL